MPQGHLSKYIRGRHGLRNIFKRNYVLRNTIGPKARKNALRTLSKYRRGGVSTGKELRQAYGEWRRDTDDHISRAQAKVIKRELREYARELEQDPHHERTSRQYFRSHQHPDADTRAHLDEILDRAPNIDKTTDDFYRDRGQIYRPAPDEPGDEGLPGADDNFDIDEFSDPGRPPVPDA